MLLSYVRDNNEKLVGEIAAHFDENLPDLMILVGVCPTRLWNIYFSGIASEIRRA